MNQIKPKMYEKFSLDIHDIEAAINGIYVRPLLSHDVVNIAYTTQRFVEFDEGGDYVKSVHGRNIYYNKFWSYD